MVMKLFFRIFFKTLRFILEPFLLLWDKVFVPKGIERSPEEQEKMDQRTKNLSLYQFNSCPFCIKVRRQVKRQSLNIPLLDAQYNQQNREELLKGGGKITVPCLKLVSDTGEVSWMYESSDIIQYLQDNF